MNQSHPRKARIPEQDQMVNALTFRSLSGASRSACQSYESY